MGMNIERDLVPYTRQAGKRWDGDGDVIPNPPSFDYRLVGMLRQQFSAKMSNHLASIVRRTAASFPCFILQRHLTLCATMRPIMVFDVLAALFSQASSRWPIFVTHLRSNSVGLPLGDCRLAVLPCIPGVFAEVLGCDCAPGSRVLPLLGSGLVLRGAVMGISQLDVRVPLSVVSGWGFPSAVVVWIFEKHHSC